MSDHLPYRVGIGHDLDISETDIIIQQPRAEFVKPGDVQFGVDGTRYLQAEHIVFTFEMVESYTLYQQILAQFNLDTEEKQDVTVWALNRRLFWNKYNGVAHLPVPEEDFRWEGMFLKNVRIYVTDLEQIA